MKNKNGLIAFALIGVAVGTAAYYLLATEDGKKTLDKANCGIKDLSKSLKALSKKEGKKAAKLAKSVKSDLENITSKVKDAGKQAVDKAAEAVNKLTHKAENL